MKNKYIYFIIITIIFLTGCNNKPNKIEDGAFDNTPSKEFAIVLENPKCNSKEKEIYDYKEDNKKIYSRCGNINIKINNEEISLGDAINKDLISINDITDKMKAILKVYDGGTVVYEHDMSENKISDSKFRLEVCNKNTGKKDITFLSITSDNYKCA